MIVYSSPTGCGDDAGGVGNDDHGRPAARATASVTSSLVAVSPVPSKVGQSRGLSQTRLLMAARWMPSRMICASGTPRRAAIYLISARSSVSA
jgi:hypothetical protein